MATCTLFAADLLQAFLHSTMHHARTCCCQNASGRCLLAASLSHMAIPSLPPTLYHALTCCCHNGGERAESHILHVVTGMRAQHPHQPLHLQEQRTTQLVLILQACRSTNATVQYSCPKVFSLHHREVVNCFLALAPSLNTSPLPLSLVLPSPLQAVRKACSTSLAHVPLHPILPSMRQLGSTASNTQHTPATTSHTAFPSSPSACHSPAGA